jgi:hypothetical protein
MPANQRQNYQDRLAAILDQSQHAPDLAHMNDLIDAFNSLKNDFNRDELSYRDTNDDYGPQGRQVPRALDPGLPEPAPADLRQRKAEQDALDQAQQHALEPGVMTGGDVNIGTPDTNPGAVGGNGQPAGSAWAHAQNDPTYDDPNGNQNDQSKPPADAINQGKLSNDPNHNDTAPHTGDKPGTDSPNTEDNETNSPGNENPTDNPSTNSQNSSDNEGKASADTSPGTPSDSETSTETHTSTNTSEPASTSEGATNSSDTAGASESTTAGAGDSGGNGGSSGGDGSSSSSGGGGE